MALSSGTPSSTVYAGDHRTAILCNAADPLPGEVVGVVVLDHGEQHDVPVEAGYFLYVAWKQDTPGDDTTDPPMPRLVGTITAAEVPVIGRNRGSRRSRIPAVANRVAE